jgi:transcription-repair coupling factor (superfamily II helicase)
VGIWEGKLVRQAILRELDRGGQVYYVHNRVRTIGSIVEQLQNLVPEASIVVGHGQMDEHRLEQTMGEFTAGKYDILVSTSIVESGLDIPNANTIIVDRADWFGLADLYQLRGRVGRSATQAYAYFFHPPHHKLSDEARQRLETISEETQLGAGFSIAMRDLEIRGAGDLLGKRQSGHIAAVGFHLYTQLLAQAVQKLRAKRGKPDAQPPITISLTIDLPIAAYIPREYIEDTTLRIQLYRRLSDLHSLQEVDAIRAELQDRFGDVPPAVDGLLYQLRVKILATYARATAIVHEQGKIGIKLPYLGTIDRYQLQTDLGEGARVSRTAIWLDRDERDSTWLTALLETLERLQVIPEEIAV